MRLGRVTAGTLAIVAATVAVAIADAPSALLADAVAEGLDAARPDAAGRNTAVEPTLAAPPFAPEAFASTEHTSPGALSADGSTLYLTRAALDFSGSRIHVARRSAERWSAPEPLFEAGFTDAGPSLSPDGARLYFHSNRPTGLDGIADDWNLFVAESRGDGWSAPRALPAPLNSAKSDCCVAAAPDGALWFASDRHGSWDVWRALPDGAGWKLEKLPEGINSSYMEWPSAVDLVDVDGVAVERLLMSSIRPARMGSFGGDDLWVAFRRPQGEWSAPRNLGPKVNGPGYEDSPRVAPDGTFLFSTRTGDAPSVIHSIAASALPLAP